MKYLKKPVGNVLFGFIFTLLFYHKPPGINVLIFELPLLLMLFHTGKPMLRNPVNRLVLAGTLGLTLAFATHGSAFTFVVHLISLVTLTGMMVYPRTRTLISPFINGFVHWFLTPFYMIRRHQETKVRTTTRYITLSLVRFGVIPVLLVLIFSTLYAFANPIFSNGMSVSMGWILDTISDLFPDINASVFFLFILGSILTSVFVYTDMGLNVTERFEINRSDDLIHPNKKNKKSGKIRNEYTMVMIILVVLNLLLALMNYSDIRFVWINFTWTGEHLKWFVHQGTYALILSILISMALVVYFFRKDLNFYKNRRLLRQLAYLWIIQNGILAVSVLIRNAHYIHYFSLAYRRIGIIFFVLTVLFGLYAIWVKISRRKSIFYLVRVNALCVYVALVCMALVPWDIVIARYNLSPDNEGFVHLEFLATLSDKALVDLNADQDRLNEIKRIHRTKFNYEEDYIGAEEYRSIIERRISVFDERMAHASVLSYTLADYLAWRKLHDQLN